MRRVALLALLAAGAIALAAAGLGGGGRDAERAREPRVLRLISDVDVNSLDPALAINWVAVPILGSVCAPLYTQLTVGSLPKPEAAAGLPRISDDGRTYVFTVRRGFGFGDGRPVTAASYAAGIRRVLDPAMRSPWAQFTADIRSVAASGSRLTIRLRRPAGDLVSRLTMPWGCPVPAGTPATPLGIDALPGSGPYTVRSRTPRRRIVLARNPHYGGDRLRRPDRIVLTVGGTPESNARDVEAGRYDHWFYFWILPPPPGGLIARLTERYGVDRERFHALPSLGSIWLAMNTARPLFAHRRARQAVAFALDRPALLAEFGAHVGQPTDRMLPSDLPGFVPGRVFPRSGADLRTARRLAGDRLRGRTAIFYVQDQPVDRRVALAIRSQLAALGVRVRMRFFQRPVLNERVGTRGEPFDLVMSGWHAYYPDPMDFVGRMFDGRRLGPRDNYNLAYFDEPAVNRALDAADALGVPRRYRALGRLERAVLRRWAPVAPVYRPTNYVLVSERVDVECHGLDGMFDPDYGRFCLR